MFVKMVQSYYIDYYDDPDIFYTGNVNSAIKKL